MGRVYLEKNNVIVNKYIREVSSLIVTDSGTKKKFIKQLKSNIEDFMESNRIGNSDALYERFGAPETVARGFWETADLKEIKRKLRNRNVLISGVVIVVLILCISAVILIYDNYTAVNGFYIKEYYISSESDKTVNVSYYNALKEKQWEIPLGESSFSESFDEWEVTVQKDDSEEIYNITANRMIYGVSVLEKELEVSINS